MIKARKAIEISASLQTKVYDCVATRAITGDVPPELMRPLRPLSHPAAPPSSHRKQAGAHHCLHPLIHACSTTRVKRSSMINPMKNPRYQTCVAMEAGRLKYGPPTHSNRSRCMRNATHFGSTNSSPYCIEPRMY